MICHDTIKDGGGNVSKLIILWRSTAGTKNKTERAKMGVYHIAEMHEVLKWSPSGILITT